MFLYKALYPTAALYAVFLIMAAFGFMVWKRSMGVPGPETRVVA